MIRMFLALLMPMAVMAATPASAAIKCRDGFQLIQGNFLATPYCQEEQLARVARGYGFKVSFAEIRDNPNTKRYICSFVGRDIRVQQTCQSGSSSGRRGY